MHHQEHRLTRLHGDRPVRGERVLYWMQASVRVRDNLALAWALEEARERRLPLEVLFCLDPAYPGANSRSFAFLLDGLNDVARGLEELGVPFTIAQGPAVPAVAAAGARAALVVFDRAYLPHGRRQRWKIAEALPCPVVLAEDNASVPTELVSDHQEWSAATLRPKLMRLATLQPALPEPRAQVPALRNGYLAEDLGAAGIDVLGQRPDRSLLPWLESQGVDSSVAPTELRGGESAAWDRWNGFLNTKLERYNEDRNDPNRDGSSGLSPYLHFGHLSPLTLMQSLKSRGLWKQPVSFRSAGEDPVSRFLDETLVRRELSFNFVLHNADHGSARCLPNWAQKTLLAHRDDRREFLYSREDWEAARTHDPAWNAAQNQLVSTGTIPNYLRMYWGKKLLEWSPTVDEAYATALALNDKYALDGRDPNTYAGVAWCFGVHDRPWGERPVYGSVRSMTYGGLKRKFDIGVYERRWNPIRPR